MKLNTIRSRRVGQDLLNGPILKSLVAFAIPIILANILQQLYSMVDLMIIGKFVGSTGTVGVSVGGELSDFLLPVSTAFSGAGQIYISQLAGAKDTKRIKETVGTLVGFMFLLSFGLMVFALLFHKQLLFWLHCPEEAYSQAAAYMIITAMGLPFVFGYNAVCSILRGMGESRKPLLFVAIAAAVNVITDILFVVLLKLDVAGTAIATVLSQLGSFSAALIYLYKNREQFDFELKLSYFKFKGEHLAVIVRLAVPQFVRSSLVRFSMLWVNSSVNSFGLVVSATNSIGAKIQKFAEVFIQGGEVASGAMIGQNLGAKKPERAKKIVWSTLAAGMVCASVSAAICLVMPKQIYGLFTNDPAVMEYGVTYLRIMVLHFFSSAFISAFQAMVTGCGFVSLGFAIGILDGVVCRIGISVIFANVLGLGALGYFWGTALSRTLPGLLCFAYFMSGKWRTRKLLSERKKS